MPLLDSHCPPTATHQGGDPPSKTAGMMELAKTCVILEVYIANYLDIDRMGSLAIDVNQSILWWGV